MSLTSLYFQPWNTINLLVRALAPNYLYPFNIQFSHIILAHNSISPYQHIQSPQPLFRSSLRYSFKFVFLIVYTLRYSSADPCAFCMTVRLKLTNYGTKYSKPSSQSLIKSCARTCKKSKPSRSHPSYFVHYPNHAGSYPFRVSSPIFSNHIPLSPNSKLSRLHYTLFS